MNIVGILVSTFPEHSARVAAQIPALGAEVHHVSPQGQIVVTLEHPLDEFITHCIDEIQALKGVLNAAMIYHQVDADEQSNTEMELSK